MGETFGRVAECCMSRAGKMSEERAEEDFPLFSNASHEPEPPSPIPLQRQTNEWTNADDPHAAALGEEWIRTFGNPE